jgi:CubicO group peptidase (beta-lactamase class C family)
MRAHRLLLLCLLGVINMSAALAATADPPPDLAQRLDEVFKTWDTPATPGASVAVIEHGKVLFEKGYGVANLEYGVPIKPDTVFHVASVSKQFTAMAIVLLERDGKLSLEDDVHKYLPELPDYRTRITLRRLLTHTSGIRDQWQVLGLAGWSLQDVITQDQILRLLFRQKELNFPPGERFLYSNGGFTLLAEIVTRVSGEPFPKFCADRIFGPLQMTHTHFHQDLTQLVPGRAYSYSPAGADHYVAEPLNYANVGATSLFTTAGDLVLWLDNFRDPKVGGPAAIVRMQEAGVLSSGEKLDYGLGIELAKYRGLRTISHDGGDAGFRSSVLWFPDQELGVAVVSNLGTFKVREAAQKVATICIGDQMQAETQPGPPKRQYTTLDPKTLGQFVGVYPLPDINQTLTVVLDRGSLWAAGQIQPPMEMHPIAPTHFYLEPLRADVEFSPQGLRGMGVTITQPGVVNHGLRISKAAMKVETGLLPYTGVYWSEELETEYTIFQRDDTLYALHAHHGEFPLTPTYRDQYSTPQWFTRTITFKRDANNAIVGLIMGGGRVTGVSFVRKPGGTLQKASVLTTSVSGAALAAVVGRYDYSGPILNVTEENGHVFAQLGLQPKFEIYPKSPTAFIWKVVDAQVTFVKDASGRVVSATHNQNGRTINAPRLPDVVEVKLDDSQTEPLLGKYSSGSRVLTISSEGGHLFSKLPDQPPGELGTTSPTELYSKAFNVRLTFVMDENHKVTSLIVHQLDKDTPWERMAD